MPLWAVLAIVGTVYLGRGFLMRGGDLSPDLPSDGVALVALVIVVAAVWTARVQHTRDMRDANAHDEEDREDSGPGDRGQHDQL